MLNARNIAALVAFTMTFNIATPVLADEGIAIIRRLGAPAPFTGVLYSDEAYANMKAENEFLVKRLALKHESELEKLKNRLQTASATTTTALNTEKQLRAEDKLEFERRESNLIAKLEEAQLKNEARTVNDILIFSGGVVAGVLVVLGSAWAISKVSSN